MVLAPVRRDLAPPSPLHLAPAPAPDRSADRTTTEPDLPRTHRAATPPASKHEAPWAFRVLKTVLGTAPAVGAVLLGTLALSTPAHAIHDVRPPPPVVSVMNAPATATASPISVESKSLADTLAASTSSFVVDGQLKIPEDVRAAIKEEHGDKGLERLDDWIRFVKGLKEKPPAEAKVLEKVNDYFNRKIKYTRDTNPVDYWQSVIETVSRGKGDCEDYSFAKYATLRLCGFGHDRLGIGIGPVKSGAGHHAVLMVGSPGQKLGPSGIEWLTNYSMTAAPPTPPGEAEPIVLDNDNGRPKVLSKSSLILWYVVDEPYTLHPRAEQRAKDAFKKSAPLLPDTPIPLSGSSASASSAGAGRVVIHEASLDDAEILWHRTPPMVA